VSVKELEFNFCFLFDNFFNIKKLKKICLPDAKFVKIHIAMPELRALCPKTYKHIRIIK
jgi:hypothetical protein